MTVEQVMTKLESLGSEQTRKTFANHGAPLDNMFGVKVGDMKTILKETKKNHDLSLALYATGNSDAMYLAGLMADEKKISENELQTWAEQATWYMISEYTVAWVAAETQFGEKLANKWIDSNQESIASSGWATWNSILTIRPDEKVDYKHILKLLDRVENTIQTEKNRVRYTMNSFLLCVGIYCPALKNRVFEIAKKIGIIDVNVGNTSCKVPVVIDYIKKAEARGAKKKKTARC